MSRLAVYFLKEIIPLYIAGFALFIVLQLTDLMSMAVGVMLQNKTPFWLALQLLTSRMPIFIGNALVMAIPFAVLIACGRLVKDSELKVAFASGIRPLSLVLPVVLFALPICVFAYYNDTVLRPESYRNWEVVSYKVWFNSPPPKQETYYTHTENNVVFYAGMVVQTDSTHAQLSGVMVKTPEATYTANTGTWDATRKEWLLYGVWQYQKNKTPQTLAQKTFLYLSEFLPYNPPPEQLSQAELKRRIVDSKQSMENRRKASFELQRRLADPMAALFFALAASSIGVLLRDRSWAFMSVIMLIFAYYVLWAYTPEMARVGAVSTLLAAWLPNLAMTGLFLGLLPRLR